MVCGLLAASSAAAASREIHSPEIDEARQLIAEAEFEKALAVLNGALAQPNNTDPMLGTLYELQGTTFLYLGEEQKARESFERLLQAVPDFEMATGTSPKLRDLFNKVKADVASRKLKPVTVSHEKPRHVRPGRTLDIDAIFTDMPSGARARLYYRRAGTEGYSSTFFSDVDGETQQAQIPAFELPEQPADYELEYYIEVGDAAGHRVAGAGNAMEPLLVKVEGIAAVEPGTANIAPEEHWYQKWWVWAIAGGVAAGGVAAVTVPMMLDDQATLPVTVKVQQ